MALAQVEDMAYRLATGSPPAHMLDMESTMVSEQDFDATLMTDDLALLKLTELPPRREMATDCAQLPAELI